MADDKRKSKAYGRIGLLTRFPHLQTPEELDALAEVLLFESERTRKSKKSVRYTFLSMAGLADVRSKELPRAEMTEELTHAKSKRSRAIVAENARREQGPQPPASRKPPN